MANEPKNARLTLVYDGKTFVLDDFPADKLDELESIAETLTQPAIVPNVIPQPPPSSSTQRFREPTITDYYSEQSTFGSNRRGSFIRFFRKRKERATAKPT